MKITLDSSGKTRDLYHKSVIGLSNDARFSVLLRANVKRKIHQRFKPKKAKISNRVRKNTNKASLILTEEHFLKYFNNKN